MHAEGRNPLHAESAAAVLVIAPFEVELEKKYHFCLATMPSASEMPQAGIESATCKQIGRGEAECKLQVTEEDSSETPSSESPSAISVERISQAGCFFDELSQAVYECTGVAPYHMHCHSFKSVSIAVCCGPVMHLCSGSIMSLGGCAKLHHP